MALALRSISIWGITEGVNIPYNHSKDPCLFKGRGYVMPEDIKAIATEVLRHRIILTYEAESEGVTTDQLIERLLEKVEIP